MRVLDPTNAKNVQKHFSYRQTLENMMTEFMNKKEKFAPIVDFYFQNWSNMYNELIAEFNRKNTILVTNLSLIYY